MPIQPNPLLARDEMVSELRVSLGSTEHGLGTVPNFVKVIIRDDMWRERVLRQTGQRVTFSTFAAFVTTPPLEGLGATLSQLRGICRDDPEALDAIDRATQSKPGRPPETQNNVPNKGPEGNTSAKALRRLRKDRPDLHARVLAKELSPHAAMVEAGFRRRTWTAPADVEELGAALIRRLSDDERRQLAHRLVID